MQVTEKCHLEKSITKADNGHLKSKMFDNVF